MFYLGQTVNYIEKQRPAIYLGSEIDRNGYVAWIFAQQDDKSFDSELVNLGEIDNLRIEDKKAPTKGALYLGANSRPGMAGLISEKDWAVERESYIKELNKANKMFFKVKK